MVSCHAEGSEIITQDLCALIRMARTLAGGLAKLIDLLCSHEALCQRSVDAAVRTEQQYTWNKNAKQPYTIIRETLDPWSGRGRHLNPVRC
jgi:hypothetical protein